VAAALQGIAARIRVLTLPGLPEKGDASDWIVVGWTKEIEGADDYERQAFWERKEKEFWELANAAPDWLADSSGKIVLTLTDFLSGYEPPAYLVDGLLIRSYFYSLTGNTGDGKTAIALLLSVYVALGGQRLGPHELEQGRVIYIAKENATDIRGRLIGMMHKLRIDPATIARNFLVVEQLDSLENDMPRIAAEAAAFGEVALVVIDTSAATFAGDNENDNPQALNHARLQRRFTTLPGKPCVLTLCHPPKNANTREHLVPRGGGAFLNEVDGNFTAFGHGDKLSDLHWTGKLRGPDFEKITFHFATLYPMELADTKGRLLPTVVAEVVTEEQEAENEQRSVFQENRLLAAMAAIPNGSLADWARECGWTLQAGGTPKPNKSLIQRVLSRLMGMKFVNKNGRGYVLTPEGLAAVNSAAKAPQDDAS
jgi:hypothetical protein